MAGRQYRDAPLDFCTPPPSRLFAVIGQSIPVFWLSILLIIVFAVNLNWLPAGGRDGFESLILPAHYHRSFPKKLEGPLIRLHIGLENVDDLKADLAAGLERLRESS